MVGFEFVPAQETEALHAESAGKMVAIFGFLNHFVTERTHLYVLSFSRFIIHLIQMFLARQPFMPLVIG